MGALHAGHISLVNRALAECDVVVASIFVNPLQFNDPKDLEKYPRTPEADQELLLAAGCSALFTPQQAGIYAGHKTREYDLGGLNDVLEGPSRPGHFKGVVNVVERLFHFVRPDVAYFGEKDRQQLTVLRHVAESRLWPERVVGCPTVREADGLAMSSRNMRLTPEERQVAPLLHKALETLAARAFVDTVAHCRAQGLEVLAEQPSVRLDHLEIVDARTLQPLADWGDRGEAVALIAAWLGSVRLIDNITLRR
jgi:pantoate--beta-alanine ligase